MTALSINILLNEQAVKVPADSTVKMLCARFKSGADVFIVNGFPGSENQIITEGDRVVLIRKGEIPNKKEIAALMAARHTPGVYEKMRRAVIGIAGLGGLGSNAAVALARMGVGSLILVDFDVVEPSNLNRQQYFLKHLGQPKVQAMQSLLHEINPFIAITAHNVRLEVSNTPDIFRSADIILECFDLAEAKVMLLETVAEALPETYYIGASGIAGYGSSNSIKSHKLGDKMYLVGDLVTAAEPGFGLMAPRVGIAASHQANLAVALLMDPEQTAGEIPDILEP